MKNLIVLALALFSFQIANAQIKLGLRAGMSTTDISTDQLLMKNSNNVKSFGLSVSEARYGFHAGLVARAQLGRLYIQPELLFNSNSVDYELEDFSDTQTGTRILNDRYQNLDIPVMLGLKLGALRIQGGPVAHMFLNSSSELDDIEGFDLNFDEWTYGYQAGLGLDIGKLMIDVKYEGNFNKLGDQISFDGRSYDFDDRPGKLVASLGITF